MNQKKLHKIFIWGFSALYLFVAGISFCHAIQFFNIGNNYVMSVMLALAFEVGLALSLVAILLSDANRKSALPWILMIVLTAVQVIGNVYSVFKYISLSGEDYYVYLQKSLLFFVEDVDQNTVQVIISWIMGAILPIIALFMTDMVANNIKSMNKGAVSDDEPEMPVRENVRNSFVQHMMKDTDVENDGRSESVKEKGGEKMKDKTVAESKKASEAAAEKKSDENRRITINPRKRIDDHYYETYERKKKS